MQNGVAYVGSSSTASNSVDRTSINGSNSTPRHRTSPDSVPQATAVAPPDEVNNLVKETWVRKAILGSLAPWSKSGRRYKSPRKQEAQTVHTKHSEPSQTVSSPASFLDPRRLLWPGTTKKEADIERDAVGQYTHNQHRSVSHARENTGSRSSHGSQPSASSDGTVSGSGLSTLSSAIGPADNRPRRTFGRFTDCLRETNPAPTWKDMPIPPMRPLTASSGSSAEQCLYPPIPDPQDPAKRLSKNQLRVQRLIVWAIVIVLNGMCVVAYTLSTRHLWVLVLILFVKAKDVLSTVTALLFLSSRKLWRTASRYKPPEVSPMQILSLITCYSETEEQIMKTIESICDNDLRSHGQLLCIILDGKPKDLVKRRILRTMRPLRRPYITWQHTRNELMVDCGFLNGTPIIYIEKFNNTGKKDSLILGHDLFNTLRADAPEYTKLLRDEIWSTMLPSLMSFPGTPRIDSIFCTDADSTIHKDAMRRLAEALANEKKAIAACGILLAELGETEWTIWSLFQQFQYCYGQLVRRQAEGIWGRVTCLPGCITMIACRPEMGRAISDYARPVTAKSFPRHQVQYLGTDRRLTYSMLSQSTDLKTVFVPDAISETVVPQSLIHYLNQRRRWGSNAYFNDWFYMLGPHQFLITRLWALIDLSRMTIVYCRQANNILFIYGLVRNFAVIKIIPLLVVTQTPTVWFVTLVLCTQPILRRRIHKLLIGLLINYLISWCLSILVFTRIVVQLGSSAWGTTGTSTARRDPALRVRTPRNSVARRLSSLLGLGTDEPPSRNSRRGSILRRMSATFAPSRGSSVPTVPGQVSEKQDQPGTAVAGAAGWFGNFRWSRSRETISRTVSHGSQPAARASEPDVRISRLPMSPTVEESRVEADRASEKSSGEDSWQTV